MADMTNDTIISLSAKGIRIAEWEEAHPEEAKNKYIWFRKNCGLLVVESGAPFTEPYRKCFTLAMSWPLMSWIDGITTGLTNEEAEERAFTHFVTRWNELILERIPKHDLD
jgi:hypothetical protein